MPKSGNRIRGWRTLRHFPALKWRETRAPLKAETRLKTEGVNGFNVSNILIATIQITMKKDYLNYFLEIAKKGAELRASEKLEPQAFLSGDYSPMFPEASFTSSYDFHDFPDTMEGGKCLKFGEEQPEGYSAVFFGYRPKADHDLAPLPSYHLEKSAILELDTETNTRRVFKLATPERREMDIRNYLFYGCFGKIPSQEDLIKILAAYIIKDATITFPSGETITEVAFLLSNTTIEALSKEITPANFDLYADLEGLISEGVDDRESLIKSLQNRAKRYREYCEAYKKEAEETKAFDFPPSIQEIFKNALISTSRNLEAKIDDLQTVIKAIAAKDPVREKQAEVFLEVTARPLAQRENHIPTNRALHEITTGAPNFSKALGVWQRKAETYEAALKTKREELDAIEAEKVALNNRLKQLRPNPKDPMEVNPDASEREEILAKLETLNKKQEEINSDLWEKSENVLPFMGGLYRNITHTTTHINAAGKVEIRGNGAKITIEPDAAIGESQGIGGPAKTYKVFARILAEIARQRRYTIFLTSEEIESIMLGEDAPNSAPQTLLNAKQDFIKCLQYLEETSVSTFLEDGGEAKKKLQGEGRLISYIGKVYNGVNVSIIEGVYNLLIDNSNFIKLTCQADGVRDPRVWHALAYICDQSSMQFAKSPDLKAARLFYSSLMLNIPGFPDPNKHAAKSLDRDITQKIRDIVKEASAYVQIDQSQSPEFFLVPRASFVATISQPIETKKPRGKAKK